MLLRLTPFIAAALVAMLPPDAPAPKRLIAHRGASAYAPEHTTAAYELAIEQHADFVEQDLGVTRDGVLVCLHDTTLERTTDVETVFPERAKVEDGRRRWPLEDFTFEELQRLDAGSWFGAQFAGARIPSWEQALVLVRGRAGVFPELKAPQSARDRGVDPAALLLASLRRHGLDTAGADPRTPVAVQSFDAAALESIAKGAPTLPRVFLIEEVDAPRWLTRDGLTTIRAFATGIGPAKAALDGRPEIVRLARELGLTVSPWTFRARSPGRFADVRDEMAYYLFDLGVDAVFTDNPDRYPRR